MVTTEENSRGAAKTKNDLRLFGVSVILLFLELLIIRWFSSELRIFAYFHNFVLIICFLGIGLGCAYPRRTVSFTLPLIILCSLTFLIHCPVDLGVFSIRNITPYLANLKDFFIWYQIPSTGIKWLLQVLLGVAMAGLLTLGIIYIFIPFGQLLGQLLSESDRPIRAYTINIFGSIAGILLFTLLAFLSTPPLVWHFFFYALLIIMLIYEKEKKLIWPALMFFAITMGLLLSSGDYGVMRPEKEPTVRGDFILHEGDKEIIWSPYHKLEVLPLDAKTDTSPIRISYIIKINGVLYLQAINLSEEFLKQYPDIYRLEDPDLIKYDHYNLAYLFHAAPDDVLIVGAGAGNDVAGALRNGAKNIDAVEIDRQIIKIGKRLHPEQPYSSDRVNIINDDARSFFHKAQRRYDLVIFGLLDASSLSSSFSNVRLDNYVYTLESLEEAKGLLKPDGTLVLIFNAIDEFIGQHLFNMMTQVFRAPPLCLERRSSMRGFGGNVFISGNESVLSDTMAKYPFLKTLVDDSFVVSSGPQKVPTDNWPYLYLTTPRIPTIFFILSGLLIVIAVVMVRSNFNGLKGIDWHFFLLGSGFLLIEVQNVSKLAMLFGATWFVNTIIFCGILMMILLANYYVSIIKIKSYKPYYLGLLIILIFIYFFPLGRLAGLAFFPKALIAGTLLSLPIFFAGIIFAHSFRNARELNKVFASNLLGAMLGGILESLSFILGIRALLLVAFLLYSLSYISLKQKEAP